jgi:hypothetical protein
MTRSASVKYTTVEVRVTPDLAPVWVNSMAGNGATNDNRPPVSRIRAGSMRDPTLRTTTFVVTFLFQDEHVVARGLGRQRFSGRLGSLVVSIFTSACCTSRLARGNPQRQTHSETSRNYRCTNDGAPLRADCGMLAGPGPRCANTAAVRGGVRRSRNGSAIVVVLAVAHDDGATHPDGSIVT